MKNPLEKYLLNLFKVDDIADINPFSLLGPTAVPGYKEAREVSITVDLLPNGKIPPPKDLKDYAPKNLNEIDYSNVSVRNILIRYASNDSDRIAYFKSAYDHISGAEFAQIQHQIVEAGGGIPRCCLELPPGAKGPQKVFVMKEMDECMYLHSYFIKTFFLITPKNLENGVLPLHPQLCAEAGLPKRVSVFDSSQNEVFFDVDYYVLIPAQGHVLSWCLSISDHWRKLKGIFALEIRIRPKDVNKKNFVLYYVVPNRIYDELKNGCIERFMRNKIDRRNLADVGLDVLPVGTQVRASFNYFCHRKGINLDTIIPLLDENFPPYTVILEREVKERKEREETEKIRGEEKMKKIN